MAPDTPPRLVPRQLPVTPPLQAWVIQVTLSASAPLFAAAGACLRAAELADRWILSSRRKRGDLP